MIPYRIFCQFIRLPDQEQMITLSVSVTLFIPGYLVCGRVAERFFGMDPALPMKVSLTAGIAAAVAAFALFLAVLRKKRLQ